MASTRSRHAQVPFEIHEDGMEMDESAHAENYKDENCDVREEDQEGESDGYSDTSEESDGVVDSAVQEDMLRLEETFKGIRHRFRLINRIGEGMYYGRHLQNQRVTDNMSRYILHRIQSRGSLIRPLRQYLGYRGEGELQVDLPAIEKTSSRIFKVAIR